MLGESLENVLGVNLCIGPPLKDGFYYDAYMGEERVDEARIAAVEKEVSAVTKAKQPFQRVVLTKEQALELFKVGRVSCGPCWLESVIPLFRIGLTCGLAPPAPSTTRSRCS